MTITIEREVHQIDNPDDQGNCWCGDSGPCHCPCHLESCVVCEKPVQKDWEWTRGSRVFCSLDCWMAA